MVRQYIWDPQAVLLSGVEQPEQFAPMYPLIWRDLGAESDSRHLYSFLKSMALTDLMRETVERWYQDECRHYAGFTQLYGLLTGESPSVIQQNVAARLPDFSGVESLVSDPVGVLAIFLWDEMSTTLSYRLDLPMYRKMGAGPARFIRLVIRDEGTHFSNFLSVLVQDYRDQIPVVIALLDELERREAGKPTYGNTFFLDHDPTTYNHEGDYFSPQFFAGVKVRILQAIERCRG